jgi:hypothetical protein
MTTKCIKRNFELEYAESEESKTMNMIEYGAMLIGKYARYAQRKLIRKSEYNELRAQIEKQLFRI